MPSDLQLRLSLREVPVMGRKRVLNPRISFSISVDKMLLDKLNHRLSYNASRSRWIADAIRSKLLDEENAREYVEKIPTEELLSELQYRAHHLPISKLERQALREIASKCRDLPESGE